MPKLHGKGDGAEAGAVAGILAGSSENIRPVVAVMRRAILKYYTYFREIQDSRIIAVLFNFRFVIGRKKS